MPAADSSNNKQGDPRGGQSPARRLRVGIDAHAIGSRLGGNETYILDVLRGLQRFAQHDYFVYVTDAKAVEVARSACPAARAIREMGHANPLVRLGYQLTALARRDRVDVLHVQYVAPLFSPPIVASIHDLSFAHFPEWYTRVERTRFQLTVPWTARRARRILTISEYSRQDIIRTLRVPPQKVAFSHLCLRETFSPLGETQVEAVARKFGIRRPYILALGNLQPRKNLPRLIDAWSQLRRTTPGFTPQLVLVGKKAWKFGEILESAGNSEFAGDIVFTGYVDGADLPALFSGARLFVYPSLFEGFGYPPLEAMGCGTPVVTSNVASLPEVCGDAAEYVDPLDTADIARATLKVYSDEDLRVRMREGGLAQAARHRNNDLGAITVRAYEEAAAESSGAGK